MPVTPTMTTVSSVTVAAPTIHQMSPTSRTEYSDSIDILTNPYQYYLAQQSQPAQQQHQQQQPRYASTAQTQLVLDNSAVDYYNVPVANYAQDDNSIYEQAQQMHQQQQSQYYVPTALAEQLMAQILHRAGIKNAVDIVRQAVKVQLKKKLLFFF